MFTTAEMIIEYIDRCDRHPWFATLVSIMMLPITYERDYA